MKARGCKFSSTDRGIKVTKGSMTILKGERTTNLYKLTGSIIVGNVSTATEKADTIRLWHMPYTKGVLYQVSNITNLIFVNFTLLVGNVE